jgi:hypothetical protein
MSVALLLISDGRDDYRDQTILSAKEHLPKLDHLIEVDDSEHRLGFAGAIQEGWERVTETDAEWVFHLEADFTFNAAVPVTDMIALLERHQHLAQVSLKRQAVNERERAAGGIVEADPDDFDEQSDEGFVWTEHRRYWTTNPSVYSTRWCRMRWPQEPESEGLFTHLLLRDPLLRFAIWGGKFEPPLVEHIGLARAGNGY